MHRAFVHRALAVLLSVVLTTGVTIRVVQANAMGMKTMSVMKTMSAMDMPMHGRCDGCAGSEKATASMACGAYCSGVVALESPSVSLDLVPAGFITAAVEATATGYGSPPDPYPPRSTCMS